MDRFIILKWTCSASVWSETLQELVFIGSVTREMWLTVDEYRVYVGLKARIEGAK